MPSLKPLCNLPHLLLVEGKDEVNLVQALCEARGINCSTIEVVDIGGVGRSRRTITELASLSGMATLRSVAVVQDSDDDAAAAFQSVSDSFRSLNDRLQVVSPSLLEKIGRIPIPAVPGAMVEGRIRTGALILPGAGRAGMLEDLCLESVRDDPAMKCVDIFLECLDGTPIEGPRNKAKARVRAFLSSRECLEGAYFEHIKACLEAWTMTVPAAACSQAVHLFLASRLKPKLDLGMAARAGYWNLHHAVFDELAGFVQELSAPRGG